HLLDVLLLDPVLRVEVLDLARDPGGKLRGVKARDRADTGSARAQRFPVLLNAGSERGDQADAGHHHAAVTETPFAGGFHRNIPHSIFYQKRSQVENSVG